MSTSRLPSTGNPLSGFDRPAKPIAFGNAVVGARVQDHWGRPGTVRWVGKLEKGDFPNIETGKAIGVEYDEESGNPLRSDGQWNGKRYFTCPAGHGMLCKPHDIYPEMNTACVTDLRQRFGDKVESWHDFELVKFCIARKFEMPKVYEMLEKHLAWRVEFQPSADEYFPPGMAEDYPCGYTGTTDIDENLVYWERPGNAGFCKSSDFVRKYQLPVIARWHACSVEMGIQRMRASNYHSKRVCYIIDLLNVNAMTGPMISFAQALATVEQDNYPENLGRVFVVNCSTFFRLAWKLVKVFIDERTNKKINFCAANKAVEVLKESMPEEDIPTFCGGTSTGWLGGANGRIGSDDPQKARCTASSPNTTAVMQFLQSEVIKGNGEIDFTDTDDTQFSPSPSVPRSSDSLPLALTADSSQQILSQPGISQTIAAEAATR